MPSLAPHRRATRGSSAVGSVLSRIVRRISEGCSLLLGDELHWTRSAQAVRVVSLRATERK